MDIYIKPFKKLNTKKDSICIGDICRVVGYKENEVRELTLIPKTDNKFFVISTIDIIKTILEKYPQASISNLGECNTVIEMNQKDENKYFKYAKIAFITSVIFAGCTTAIITFHNDTQLERIFDIYSSIIGLNTSGERRWFLEIPYALGIGIGIIVFFNHIGTKKITRDPTPIEVEMVNYETEVIDAIVDGKER